MDVLVARRDSFKEMQKHQWLKGDLSPNLYFAK